MLLTTGWCVAPPLGSALLPYGRSASIVGPGRLEDGTAAVRPIRAPIDKHKRARAMVELSHPRNAAHARRQTQSLGPNAARCRRKAGSLRRLACSTHIDRGNEAPVWYHVNRQRCQPERARHGGGYRLQVRRQYSVGL